MKKRSNEQFVADYKRYVEDVLSVTRDEAKDLFKTWKDPIYWKKYSDGDQTVAIPAPIQRIQTRIKRLESVVDKITRRTDVFPEGLKEKCLRRMKDTFGMRIVLFFLNHLEIVDKELRSMEADGLIEFSPIDIPEAYMASDMHARLNLGHIERKEKDSGYVSIHYQVRLKKSKVRKSIRPWFEIQVRTLAEDAWGEIEHLLGYKPDRDTSLAVKKQFQIISKQLGAIDEHFNFLYEELARFQHEVLLDDAAELNAENLPSVLAKWQITCSQGEVHGLLKILRSHEVHTVGAFTELHNRTRETIDKVFGDEDDRPPDAEEIVATMAYLHNSPEQNYEMRIKEWRSIAKTWEELKSEQKV